MTEHWEKIRNSFRGDNQEVFTIRHPYSILGLAAFQNFSVGNPTFKITSSEVKEVFAPVLEKIESLVHGQVDAVCNKEGQDPKVSTTRLLLPNFKPFSRDNSTLFLLEVSEDASIFTST